MKSDDYILVSVDIHERVLAGLNFPNLDRLNVEVVASECDSPHSDSTWPHSPENTGAGP